MLHGFRRFLKDRNGATAVEYGLIIAVLTLAVVGGFKQASGAIEYLFGNNESEIRKALDE